MALSAGERTGSTWFRGLDQFHVRGDTDGVGYCIAEAKPYALEFSNTADVICLLLGDISSSTKFEDDCEKPLIFLSESTAFHPRIGNVRVRADEVRHGFIAFSYAEEFQGLLDDRSIDGLRRAGSCNNIRNDAIKFLARYVKERLRRPERLQPLELQFLALGTYTETMRQLDRVTAARRSTLSDQEFARLCDYVEENLEGKLTCADLSRAANLPLRTVYESVKARTGRSPYSLIIEKRIERACSMLRHSNASIAEIACACGFSSQQHLTATLSRRLGRTPRRLREES
ncbi:MAG: AraC family transcriptional regulator [Xanthobacteraceae bacterium]|jgi:AraC family transcriptional regulator